MARAARAFMRLAVPAALILPAAFSLPALLFVPIACTEPEAAGNIRPGDSLPKDTLPNHIDSLATGTWFKQPSTKLRGVLFPGRDMGDPVLMMEAWSGGALDPRTGNLIVLGGGMGNYKGNELYSFSVADLKWTRLTEPCTDFACADPNPCGQPIVRHTYNGVAFIGHADRLFLQGGAYNCEGKACTMRETWTFDMASRKWQRMQPKGDLPDGNSCGVNSAYDPESKLVYYVDETGFSSYNLEDNAWKRLDKKGSYYQTAAIDTKRGLYMQFGSGSVTAYDLRKPGSARVNVATSGDQAIVQATNPGVEYDAASDRLVGWAGGSAYSLNPDTKAWEKHASTGAPTVTDNGMFGRWRYVASHNVFIAVTGVDADVSFFKASAGPAKKSGSAPVKAAPKATSGSLPATPKPRK